MGCVSSSDSGVDGGGLPSDRKLGSDDVVKQRRRLSVTPGLVGDVEGQRLKLQVPETKEEPAKPVRRLSLGPVVDDSLVQAEEKIDLKHTAEAQTQSITNEFVAVTKKGFVPYNLSKANQDSYIMKTEICGNSQWSMFGVCDGHGEFGHHVSAFVKEKLPVFFEELGSARIEKDPVQALKDAVEMVTSKLARSKINTTFSGTTLVFGFRMGDVLYVGNVGDSRCVLASDSASGLVTKALSWDQKPEVEEERSRIIARGGRVHTLQVPPGEDPGPLRVWLKDVDVPGLAMTRSIGDSVSHSVGVISQPDIQRFELTSDDLFVVWASDGVWEFMENQEVVEGVRKLLPNIEKATTSLVLEAESRWKKFESVVDDITAVILFLKNVS